MGITDLGIYRIGQLIQGQSNLYPTHITFSTNFAEFDEDLESVDGEIIRKPVTWGNTGIHSKFTVELNSAEANGSYIQAIGLFDNSEIGSGNLWVYDESFIGSKNDSFNVQIEGEIVFLRPE